MYNLEFNFETNSFWLSPLEFENNVCDNEIHKKQKEDLIIEHENQTYITFD